MLFKQDWFTSVSSVGVEIGIPVLVFAMADITAAIVVDFARLRDIFGLIVFQREGAASP